MNLHVLNGVSALKCSDLIYAKPWVFVFVFFLNVFETEVPSLSRKWGRLICSFVFVDLKLFMDGRWVFQFSWLRMDCLRYSSCVLFLEKNDIHSHKLTRYSFMCMDIIWYTIVNVLWHVIIPSFLIKVFKTPHKILIVYRTVDYAVKRIQSRDIVTQTILSGSIFAMFTYSHFWPKI